MRKSIRSHGAAAYAVYFALLEYIYTEEGEFRILTDELWLENLADDLRITDYRVLIRILDTFAETGLIDNQMWQGDHSIFIQAVLERGDNYLVKRAKETEKKRIQRAKKPPLSPGDKTGTKGQTPVLSPSDPDPYSDSDSEADLDLPRASDLRGGEARENEPATPTGSEPAASTSVQQSESPRPEPPTVSPPPPVHDLFARRGIPQVIPIRAQFEGPWGVGYTDDLKRFEDWLLATKAKGKDNPSAWMAAVVDGIAKGGSRALWTEFQQAEVAAAAPAKPAADRMAELLTRVQAQIDSGVA